MLILDEILDKGKIAIKYIIGNWCNWNSNCRVDNSVRSMLSFLNFMIILWLCNKIHLLLGNTNLSIKGQVCLQYTFKWFWKKILYTHTHVKHLPANAGDVGSIPGSGRSPGKGMTTHSSILALEIPWTGEPGGLLSMGSQRVGHNWATKKYGKIKNICSKQTERYVGILCSMFGTFF